ncbi:RYamide receptor-like [Oculina patagonica]
MLNTTMNGTQSLMQSSSCYNPTAANIGQTFALCLIFVVSIAGNIFIGIIVYKTKTMRKPINFLIVNMAMSDLLFPIFWIPQIITELYVDSWLISGPLGQALSEVIHRARRAISQRETATQERGTKCAENDRCYCFRVCINTIVKVSGVV